MRSCATWWKCWRGGERATGVSPAFLHPHGASGTLAARLDCTPRLIAPVPCVIQLAMKTARPARPKKSSGTVQAEALRARSNKLTEAVRKKLRDEEMRLFYGCDPNYQFATDGEAERRFA